MNPTNLGKPSHRESQVPAVFKTKLVAAVQR